MTYEIDQSGKVEDTNTLTIVAYANGKIKSIKINSVEKQKLVVVLRVFYSKWTYIYKIFAALIYFLLVDEDVDSIVIDREYFGQEAIIKGMIIQLFKKNRKVAPRIQFNYVGKSSPAHKAALDVFRGNREADLEVKAQDILKLF